MQLARGTTLGSYVIEGQVSAGAMAVVYRARHKVLEREVALKVLSPELLSQPGFTERFFNEARTLAQLDHPNILPLFEFGSANGVTFLSMPLVLGGTLRRLVDGGPMEPGLAWRYLRELAKALQYAHEKGVVHRDVKPSNVLIHADGRGMLADFGLARRVAIKSDLSGIGLAIGTPGYMAPEQALGVSVDHRADIYALGVIVFEMLTGSMPFREETDVGVVMKTLEAPIPSAHERNPRLPKEVDAVLERALAKRPNERQQSARDLLEELRQVPFGPPATTPAFALSPPADGASQAAGSPPPPVAEPSRQGAHGIPGALVPSAFLRQDAYTVSTPTGRQVEPGLEPLPMPGAIVSEVARALSETPPPSPSGSAVGLLEQMGVSRLRARQRYLQNAFVADLVGTARQAAGELWRDVVREAAIPELLQQDPPDNLERNAEVALPSRLNEAFESTLGGAAPDALKLWGRSAAERWLEKRGGHQHRLGLIPGQERRLAALLRSHVAWLDSVRGEPLNAWKQLDEHIFWLVQYGNLLALGRPRREKACLFWVSALETLLRWAGLANDWLVEEVECGCQTRTFDCVFAIRSAMR